MKLSGYYIYNNVAITALAIMSMLSVSPRIPLSKVALLMPILLDDNITQKMTYQNYNSFDSVHFASFKDKNRPSNHCTIESNGKVLAEVE